MLTEWDCEHRGSEMHLRSTWRDGWLCTAYEPGTVHTGDEGELYDCTNDPEQWNNLWDDPQHAKLRGELVADLYDHLPPAREPRLEKEAEV